MKKISWLFFASALSLFIQSEADSQISLTSSDLPNYFAVGTSLFGLASHDTVVMDVGRLQNAYQVWNAPTVKFVDSIRTDNVDPSSTPYISDFPGAVYAQNIFETDSNLSVTNYYYFKVSNDSVINMGFVARDSGKIGSTTIDTTTISKVFKLFFPLPFQLGDSFIVSTDSSAEEGGLFTEVLSTVATADAWGQMGFPSPGGQLQALRVSSTTSEKIYVQGVLISNTVSYSMSWYTKEGYELSVELDTLKDGDTYVHFVQFIYPGKTPTSAVRTSRDLPSNFALAQNYPNPFNPTTVISYQLPVNSHVTLKVYDMLGREVVALVNQRQDAGSYSVRFDGSRLASGIYFYRLEAGNFVSVKKLVVVK